MNSLDKDINYISSIIVENLDCEFYVKKGAKKLPFIEKK